MSWQSRLAILLATTLIFILFRFVRNRPELFNLTNMNKSLRTLGMLALLLMGFIGLCLILLRGM